MIQPFDVSGIARGADGIARYLDRPRNPAGKVLKPALREQTQRGKPLR
jgi:hypothetical protein